MAGAHSADYQEADFLCHPSCENLSAGTGHSPPALASKLTYTPFVRAGAEIEGYPKVFWYSDWLGELDVNPLFRATGKRRIRSDIRADDLKPDRSRPGNRRKVATHRPVDPTTA